MTAFMVTARCYPDLDPDYDGPALSIEDQIQGITREWPIQYGSRAEAQACIDRLRTQPDPSFCHPEDEMEIVEI